MLELLPTISECMNSSASGRRSHSETNYYECSSVLLLKVGSLGPSGGGSRRHTYAAVARVRYESP